MYAQFSYTLPGARVDPHKKRITVDLNDYDPEAFYTAVVTDDVELAEIRRKCVSGEITCGQCKKETAERVIAFLKDFREKMDAAAERITV